VPLGFGTGQIVKLAVALLEGDGNLIDHLIERKLEDLGEELISEIVGGPLGSAQRIGQALETGGQSELERLGNQALSKARPGPLPFSDAIKKLQHLLEQAQGSSGQQQAGNANKRARADWAKTRQEWLDNRWRHDWRSQPRNVQGRWIPGRLSYVDARLQYAGVKPGRTVRTFRKKRRAKRAAARKLARRMMQGDHGD